MTTNQLTRRTNNTQNRKLADTTNKRPISALKIDQNQPFKKIKPTSPHQLHSTPLNLIRKCPAPPSPIPNGHQSISMSPGSMHSNLALKRRMTKKTLKLMIGNKYLGNQTSTTYGPT
ncbi:hypothetical protein KEM48_002888 [Puccinia striiformis f. sp. tritici PST-130]|nr:hypothetical protein KEM48_002888 [Puccinia striiformis f. sp. tritici PST-130]